MNRKAHSQDEQTPETSAKRRLMEADWQVRTAGLLILGPLMIVAFLGLMLTGNLRPDAALPLTLLGGLLFVIGVAMRRTR